MKITIAGTGYVEEGSLRSPKASDHVKFYDDITIEEMATLESLDIYDQHVDDYSDLKYAINLKELYISNNEIDDLTIISQIN